MEMKLFSESIATEKIIVDTSVEQAIDCEISLPEYCNDIQRILKCQIMPGVASTNVSGDRLTISGTSCLRLFYADENSGAVRQFQQQLPFERTVDLPNNNCASPFVKTNVKMEFCNCRAINQRRVDVHAAFSIKVRVSCQDVENLLVDCQGCGTQLRCKEREVVNRIGAACRNFSLEETFEIGQSKPTIKSVLNTSAVCCVTEVKVITNKILVKGEVKAKVLYCSDGKDEAVECIESIIPTSQIIDLEGITEEHLCCVNMQLGVVDIAPKADLNGEYRMMELSGKLFIEITALEKRPMKLISDAYSTTDNLICEERMAELPSLLANIDDTMLFKNIIEFSDIQISRIFDIYVGGVTCNYKIVEEKVMFYGVVTINVLYADGEENACYVERPFDFEYDTGVVCRDITLDCRPEVTPLSLDYSIRSASNIEVRIEQKIIGVIIRKTKEKFITSIAVDTENPKVFESSALTIYFASENELVWDIARKFNSTQEAIYAENSLTDEVIKKPVMLLIPGV